ncbi:MAG: hypothetical protein AB4352_05090 [Hormoscilla sp.]
MTTGIDLIKSKSNQSISNLTVAELEAIIVEIVRKTIREERSNRESGSATEDPPSALLSTFGSWEDTRSTEEIIAEIYASRTISSGENNP